MLEFIQDNYRHFVVNFYQSRQQIHNFIFLMLDNLDVNDFSDMARLLRNFSIGNFVILQLITNMVQQEIENVNPSHLVFQLSKVVFDLDRLDPETIQRCIYILNLSNALYRRFFIQILRQVEK